MEIFRLGTYVHTNMAKMTLRGQELLLLATGEATPYCACSRCRNDQFGCFMLPVLSFSSSNSERRLDMEHNTDLNGPKTRRYRTTLFEYREL